MARGRTVPLAFPVQGSSISARSSVLNSLGVDDVSHWLTLRMGDPSPAGLVSRSFEEKPMTDVPELTKRQLAGAIPARVRKRLMAGRFESGDDVAALRRFARLTQAQFARAMGISVHTLRNWEQGRRTPEGPAIALLRIAARHPRILRENLRLVA
jgi:putative transcriptional regulator